MKLEKICWYHDGRSWGGEGSVHLWDISLCQQKHQEMQYIGHAVLNPSPWQKGHLRPLYPDFLELGYVTAALQFFKPYFKHLQRQKFGHFKHPKHLFFTIPCQTSPKFYTRKPPAILFHYCQNRGSPRSCLALLVSTSLL